MAGAQYFRPAWRVLVDGQDISGKIQPRLMSLAITECRTDEADQLDIVISDADGQMAIPRRNAQLRVLLGWEGGQMVDKGTYLVDEVEYSGSPDTITLRARSADMTSALRTRTDRSFHSTTIGKVVETIAKAHGLTPAVSKAMAEVKIQHIDQTGESDAAFLNRIGKRYDAVATVKDGRLLFVPMHAAQTASGAAMPSYDLARSDGDSFRFHVSNRDTYTGVRAFWQDKKGGKRRSVLAGVIGNAKRMRELFASEADALDNARAEWLRLQRGTATLQFQLAYGRPELAPQTRIRFPAMKAPMGEITWLLSRVEHRLDESGLTTRLEGETLESAEKGQDDDSGDGDESPSAGDAESD